MKSSCYRDPLGDISEAPELVAPGEERIAIPPQPANAGARVHIWLGAACTPLLLASIAGAIRMSNSGWGSIVVGTCLLAVISMVPALLWHDRKDYEKRDAALMLPWIILLVALIPYLTTLCDRLGFPLRDNLYARMDRMLGFNVASIVGWTVAHPFLERTLIGSYRLLRPLLIVAAFFPAALGKRKAAERFALSNMIACLIALPLFALVPAIGPWTAYHFTGTPAQQWTEAAMLALRTGGPPKAVGLGCLPSYHVMWAIFSASALWPFRFLRLPATVLAVLIVISTVTTGWHYAVDAITGVLVAGLCLYVANAMAESARHR